MLLNLRKKEDCAFDMIALGEIMLRLDPGDTRIKTTRSVRGKAAANTMSRAACAAASG